MFPRLQQHSHSGIPAQSQPPVAPVQIWPQLVEIHRSYMTISWTPNTPCPVRPQWPPSLYSSFRATLLLPTLRLPCSIRIHHPGHHSLLDPMVSSIQTAATASCQWSAQITPRVLEFLHAKELDEDHSDITLIFAPNILAVIHLVTLPSYSANRLPSAHHTSLVGSVIKGGYC